MKNFLIILFVIPVFLSAQNLPHRLTNEERAAFPAYLEEIRSNQTDLLQAPPSAVRTMAEWEELQGLQITWTSYYEILAQIVDYAQEEVTVYIVCSDSGQVKAYLYQRNIPLTNLKFIEESYNTIWCRDYGPWTVYENDVQTMDIVDWIYNRPRASDDAIPTTIASEIGVDIYEAVQSPDDLIHTGGNFMVDGHGTGFASELILDENPGKTETEIDDISNRYLGLDRFIKMETLPYDEIHHIDMHMKLLDEETLLVGEYPTGVADGPQIETNLQYILNNFQTCFNRPYNVVRIPMPPDARGRYPSSGGEYRTYTNSVIVNKTVIVPVYEEQYDTTALRIYREAMPGYNVVGIDCNDIIGALGAIHCITKEIGVDDPVWISHAKLQDVYQDVQGYEVTAKIKSASTIEQANVFWSTDTSAGLNILEMTATGTDSFTVNIPAQADGAKIYYYLSAQNSAGKEISKPLVRAEGCYSFTVQSPSKLESPVQEINSCYLAQNYPNPFNPQTTIHYELAENSNVILEVFNATGQKVRTLARDKQIAGSYQVRFNGKNLPSGVYFYRLTANKTQQIRKMLLVR